MKEKEDIEYIRKLKEYELWGNLSLGEKTMKGCDETFKYFGSIIHRDSTYLRNIKMKTAWRNKATNAVHGLIWNKTLTKESEKKICYRKTLNNTLYGAEL